MVLEDALLKQAQTESHLDYYYQSFYNDYFERHSIARHLNFLVNTIERDLWWYSVFEQFVTEIAIDQERFDRKTRKAFCETINAKTQVICELNKTRV
jgi:hypothetical protein